MQVVVKLHSRCNINCTYCYMFNKGDSSYLDKPKSLPWAVIEKIPAMLNSFIEEHGGKISLCFHGGEPLLFGTSNFESMMEYLSDTSDLSAVKFSLQTNAILINPKWLSLFRKFNVGVSASLDGTRRINDIARNYSNGRSSFDEAERGIKLLRDGDVNFAGVICVAQAGSDGREVVEYFIDELKLDWFDLLLPDFTHDELSNGTWNRTQQALSEFMNAAFDAWFERLPTGSSCRFFESIIARGFGYSSGVDTIGKDGVQTIILETDGTLEPHDVARICVGMNRHTGISVGRNAIQRLLLHENYRAFLGMDRTPAEKCRNCQVFNVCRGGHLFHRYSRQNRFQNASVHCTVLETLITHVNTVIAGQISCALQ